MTDLTFFSSMWPALLLVPLVAIYRIVMAWQMSGGLPAHPGDLLTTWLPGFCPLAGVALCAGAFLPRRLTFTVPLLILLASDVIIDAHYGAPLFAAAMLGRYGLLALICGAGLLLQSGDRRPGFAIILLATVAASTFFYVASNTLAWAGATEYPQTAAGWLQSLTTGLPGYLPSWYFYRNALVSDSLYSMVFVACLARDTGVRTTRADVPTQSAAV